MTAALWFLAGLFAGANVGVLVAGLCRAAKNGDRLSTVERAGVRR